MSTKDLINAIISGEAIEIENAFNATMAEKISTRLDDMRQDVAQNLFKAPELETAVVEESVELDEAAVSTIAKAHGFVKQTSGIDKGSYKHPNTGETITSLRGDSFGHSRKDGSTVASFKHKDTLEKHLASHGYKKTANESVELTEEEIDAQIQEVLSKDASAGEWISDFVKSDNPKFEGKSKEKRKQMALAAYYAKQRSE